MTDELTYELKENLYSALRADGGDRERVHGDDRFDAFWRAYPRKVAKDAARRAFDRRRVDDALLKHMVAALARQKQSSGWQKDGGQFIPHPATWLNGGRWEDESVSSGTTKAQRVRDCYHDPPCRDAAAHTTIYLTELRTGKRTAA